MTTADDDYTALRAELVGRGHREIAEATRVGIKPGDRVRHHREQYPRAYDEGTATVLAVMTSDRLIWGRLDVEIIVRRDEPWLPSMSSVTNWTDYNTCAVRGKGAGG